jgi:hypothetical protein
MAYSMFSLAGMIAGILCCLYYILLALAKLVQNQQLASADQGKRI